MSSADVAVKTPGHWEDLPLALPSEGFKFSAVDTN